MNEQNTMNNAQERIKNLTAILSQRDFKDKLNLQEMWQQCTKLTCSPDSQ
jgi:hypothetical protein